MTALPRNPVAEVFAIPELLEAILLSLQNPINTSRLRQDTNGGFKRLDECYNIPPVHLLPLQRVSKAFQATISTSPRMQKAMFFRCTGQNSNHGRISSVTGPCILDPPASLNALLEPRFIVSLGNGVVLSLEYYFTRELLVSLRQEAKVENATPYWLPKRTAAITAVTGQEFHYDSSKDSSWRKMLVCSTSVVGWRLITTNLTSSGPIDFCERKIDREVTIGELIDDFILRLKKNRGSGLEGWQDEDVW